LWPAVRVLSVGNMYPPHHLGGYELMWRSWVAQMSARGHEVAVLTTDFVLDEPDPGIAEEPRVARELRWYWKDHEFPRITLGSRLRIERHNQAVLRGHLARFKPGLVAWWAMGGMSMSLLEEARRSGTPAVGFVHDDWMVYGPHVDAWQAAFGGRPARLVERLSGIPTRIELPAAAKWAFVSEATRYHAAREYPALATAAVIHSGIDAPRFSPAASREWKGELLLVGRIDPRKGTEVAVRALGLLPGMSLRVVGGGDAAHRRSLEELARSVGGADRIRFETLPRAAIPQAYADADAVLFPVLWEEPWGLVPLEAMAMGRPVVASGLGGSGEFLVHERNALLYRPADSPEALAAAVRALAADTDLRQRLRAGGLETASHHTEDTFADAAEELMHGVAA
jgi:glycogen(starch) synthase